MNRSKSRCPSSNRAVRSQYSVGAAVVDGPVATACGVASSAPDREPTNSTIKAAKAAYCRHAENPGSPPISARIGSRPARARWVESAPPFLINVPPDVARGIGNRLCARAGIGMQGILRTIARIANLKDRRAPGLRERPDLVILGVREGVEPSRKPPVRVFVGTEPGQYRAERVFIWSIEQNRDPARVFEIHVMTDLRSFDRRRWLTCFTKHRFAIPHYAGRH